MADRMILDAFSSRARPVLRGTHGGVSAAHPLAAASAQGVLADGGSAADATIAAQAVLCVVAPDSCGLGGDGLCLVRSPDGEVMALNGSGALAAKTFTFAISGGASVTVPGLVHCWGELSRRWGKVPLTRLLAPAIDLARHGFTAGSVLAEAARSHADRLSAGGAEGWAVFGCQAGDTIRQPVLARTLEAIVARGPAAFYEGALATATATAAQRHGGSLSIDDIGAHTTPVLPSISIAWRGTTVHVQPPMSQGVLLSLCLKTLDRLGALTGVVAQHRLIELTEASFALRDRVQEGGALLDESLSINLDRAAGRGGPRAYLHTAGVAAADRAGLVVTSLVSVFDDFGSCVFVPEAGFVLNNRGAGFTHAPNDAAPGKRPIHTLAPILVSGPFGILGLATPGADGQVQTLLQILQAVFVDGVDLATAIDAPRWRSEDGKILIEAGHPAQADLAARGHALQAMPSGHVKFGALVCAGQSDGPFAVSDWRRETWSGVA